MKQTPSFCFAAMKQSQRTCLFFTICNESFFALMKQKRDFFCCDETKSEESSQLSFYFNRTVFCFNEAKAELFFASMKQKRDFDTKLDTEVDPTI
jgi:hypothetical protein